MKVVSFKVDLREYAEIKNSARDESIASYVKKIVMGFVSRPSKDEVIGRLTIQRNKIYNRGGPTQDVQPDPEKVKSFRDKWR